MHVEFRKLYQALLCITYRHSNLTKHDIITDLAVPLVFKLFILLLTRRTAPASDHISTTSVGLIFAHKQISDTRKQEAKVFVIF